MSGPEPGEGPRQPEYTAARLRRALAEDERTAELGIQVDVRGEHVYLTGAVSSQRCKERLDAVLHERAPKLRLHNDVRVVEATEPGDAEVLG